MNLPLLQPENREELDRRLEKVTRAMSRHDMEAILIASSPNLLYLTGTIFRGYVYVSKDHAPLFFFIAPSVAPIMGNAFNIHKPEMIPGILNDNEIPVPGNIGLEFDDMLYNDVERLKHVFPDSSALNGSTVMREARITKTELEIQKIREDGMHQAQVYKQIPKLYKEGMTDQELQIEIERILRLEGCLGYLRVAGSRMELNMGSLIAGDNADAPSPYDFSMGGAGVDPSLPVGADGSIILPGTSVMVDMNGGFNGYQSDMTRCWYLENISDLARKAHDCSRAILAELEKTALPGTPASKLYDRAVEIAESERLADYFMGHRSKAKFIGHGVGIELNEAPVIMTRNHNPLEENMVIALEPKFVIPHVGAVGVENTYRVTSRGLENLTVCAEELEEL